MPIVFPNVSLQMSILSLKLTFVAVTSISLGARQSIKITLSPVSFPFFPTMVHNHFLKQPSGNMKVSSTFYSFIYPVITLTHTDIYIHKHASSVVISEIIKHNAYVCITYIVLRDIS